MNNHILHQSELDVIALETKHQQDYERSLTIHNFCQSYQDDTGLINPAGNPQEQPLPRDTFEDGQWDGFFDFEPQAYQWLERSYRSGYLSGVARKYDEQFSQ